MAKSIKIDGLDDVMRWMDDCPENCVKASRTALREAAKKTTKAIRPGVPKRWRRLVKYKVSRMQNGSLVAGMGLFNGHQRQGRHTDVDDWFKAYWANYGTLTHRDPNHKFQQPVKNGSTSAAKRRRNNVGQKAQNFFESATRGYEERFVRAFEEELAKQEDTFYE